MARVMDLKTTASTFQVRGTVTGVKSKRFYNSGSTKTGGAWHVVEFGLNINEHKTVFFKLFGMPRNEVYYYKRSEVKGAKGTSVAVPWKDRKKSPGEGYNLIGVTISTDKNEDGGNVNHVFTEYDAVEYLRDHLKDGESMMVKGNVDFSTYTDREGNVRRKIELVPNGIFYTREPIDFKAEGYKEEALFDDVLVYTDIDKETDENGKNTGRFILSGYSVKYNDIVPVQFIMDEDHAKLAGNLKKKLKPYNSIHVYGNIDVIVNIEEVQQEDDGWGTPSKMENNGMIGQQVRREYVVSRALPETIDMETYSEKSVAAALKAIKNAKEAVKNFTGKESATVNDEDWSMDDSDDADDIWD